MLQLSRRLHQGWPDACPLGGPGCARAGGDLSNGLAPPTEFDPSWSRRPWLRRHWRLSLGVALIGSILAMYAVLIIGVSQMASVPTQRIASDLSEATGGEILSVLPEPPILAGGKNHFDLFVADDVTSTEARRLACKVVPGILAHDGYAGISFTLERVGAPDLADSSVPCN